MLRKRDYPTIGACNNGLRKLDIGTARLEKIVYRMIPRTREEATYLQRIRREISLLREKRELVMLRREELIAVAMSEIPN